MSQGGKILRQEKKAFFKKNRENILFSIKTHFLWELITTQISVSFFFDKFLGGRRSLRKLAVILTTVQKRRVGIGW